MSDTRLNIGITADDRASIALQSLEAAIRKVRSEIVSTTAAMAGYGIAASAIEQVTASQYKQIGTLREMQANIRAEMAARQEAISVLNREREVRIEAALGPERAMKSASASAAVLARDLGAAAEADDRLRQAAAEAAGAIMRQTGAMTAMQAVSGAQFFGTFERKMGIGQEALSAQASAAAFQAAMGAAGTGITSVDTRRTIEDLHGINREMLSAEESARAMALAMGEVGGALTLTAAAGFSKLAADLAGVKTNFLSAEESAKVFSQELGEVGGRLTLISSGGFSKLVSDLAGVKTSFLSAAESARAMEAALGPVGERLTLTPAAGFSKMVADLAQVKTSYLSAAESAKVFAQAGLTATEQAAGMTEASLAVAVAAEKAGTSAAMVAAKAAAAATMSGASAGAAQAAGAKAATAALEREALAAKSVEAAMMAAAAAGASQGEITAAGAAAATAALSMQGNAARGAAGGAGVLGREMRHVVGLFDALSRGQFGQAMSSVGAALRDAGASAATLGVGITALVAVMATRAILRHAEELGKWAESARAAASAAGMSIGAYTALQGAMTLTGVKAEEADSTMRRFATNLSTAMKDPASKTAEAFKVLGISQEELAKTGGNTEAAFKLVAQAFTETADSANKSAAMMAIFGRNFESVIPALQRGKSGLEELEDEAKKLGITLTDDSAQALISAGEAVTHLGQTIRGEGIQAMVAWAPEIKAIAGDLEQLVHIIGSVTSAIGAMASTLSGWMQANADAQNRLAHSSRALIDSWTGGLETKLLGPLPPLPEERNRIAAEKAEEERRRRERESATTGKREVPEMVDQPSEIQQMHAAEQAAREAASAQHYANRRAQQQAELQAEIQVIRDSISHFKEGSKQKLEAEQELNEKLTSLHDSEQSAADAAARKGAAAAKAAARQSYQDFKQMEELKIAEAQGSSQKILAIYTEWADAAKNIYKQQLSEIERIEKDKVKAYTSARLAEIQEDVRINKLKAEAAKVTGEAQRLSTGKPESEASAASFRQQAQDIDAAASQTISKLAEVMNAAEAGSSVQKKAAEEILQTVITAKQAEVEAYKKANEASKKAAEQFTQLFDKLGSSFESLAGTVLDQFINPSKEYIKAGFATIKVSMQSSEIRNAILNVFKSAMSSVTDIVGHALSKAIAGALSGGTASSIGELLGGWLSKAFSSIMGSSVGSAAGGAAGGAAASAPTVAAIGTLGGTLTGAMTAQTGAIVGAIEALTAIESANLAKPSVLGTTFGAGGIVPSAAGGMVLSGPGGASLSILHPQEMVLPAPISRGLQALLAQGNMGSANVNYAPTIQTSGSRTRGGGNMSRADFSEMLSTHSRELTSIARNKFTEGWRPMTGAT